MLEKLTFKPVMKMAHRRRARIETYATTENGIELTVRIQDHKTYRSANQATALAAVLE